MQSWTAKDASFDVLAGISADFGDDPTVKSVDIMGYRGMLGHVTSGQPTWLALSWDEGKEVCLRQYAVESKGLAESQLIRIARSLQERDVLERLERNSNHIPESPESLAPAAGICGGNDGPVANVTLGPELDRVPKPRCLKITHDQHLSVTNDTNITFTARLGRHYVATILPGATHTFATLIGDYFSPGAYILHLGDISAADIWVDPICNPQGAECSTPQKSGSISGT